MLNQLIFDLTSFFKAKYTVKSTPMPNIELPRNIVSVVVFIVDNCFATPYLQQPIKYGADLVIHSGTKWIDGQGRVVGGAVVGNPDLIQTIYGFCRSTGPSISPFNAWVLSKSLETLAVRMERHSSAP